MTGELLSNCLTRNDIAIVNRQNCQPGALVTGFERLYDAVIPS